MKLLILIHSTLYVGDYINISRYLPVYEDGTDRVYRNVGI